MSKETPLATRLVGIGVTLTVLAVGVILVGNKIRSSAEVKAHQHEKITRSLKPMNLIEKKHQTPNRVTFTSPVKPLHLTGAKKRDLETYYSRRAYPGAPPFIPHILENDHGITQNCNSCHEKGGYVPHLQAFTPVTPHPEFRNCLQCHAQRTTDEKFRENEWLTFSPPKLKRTALPGGPPQIPHSLQLRTNCIACHGGSAAPTKIYCPHPERVNCLQCHTPSNTDRPFVRPFKVQP